MAVDLSEYAEPESEGSAVDLSDYAEQPPMTPRDFINNQFAMEGPNIRYEPDQGASLTDLAVSSLADDPIKKIDYLASQRFPEIPLEEARKRYGIFQDQIIFRGDDGQLYAEAPTMAGRLASHSSKAAAPIVGGAVAIGTAPMNLMPGGTLMSAELAGLAAGGTEMLRQGLGEQYLADPVSGGQIAMETGLNALPVPAGRGVMNVQKRQAAKDISRMDQVAVDDLANAAAAEGIDLTPAEMTNLSSLRGQQRVLAGSPQTADRMGDFFSNRADQVETAVERQLGRISQQDSQEVAGTMAREASKEAMDRVAAHRARKASPIYTDAFDEAPIVDVGPLVETLDHQIAMAKGSIKSKLLKVRRMLVNKDEAGEEFIETNLESLHNVKMEIDEMLSKGGDSSVGNVTRGKLTGIKHKLLGHMEEASSLYGEARKIYSDLSPAVDSVREGLVGVIAGLKDKSLQDAATNMFTKTGPRSARQARILLSRADPEAWQAIKRAYLQDMWEKAGRNYATVSGKRTAGIKFNAFIFGTKKRRAILRETLSPQEYADLSRLSNVLEATGRALDVNSDTAWKQEMLRIMKDEAGSVIDNVAAPHQIFGRARDALAEFRYGKYVDNLAYVITSPDAMQRLKQLRQLNPRDARAAVIAMELLLTSGRGVAAATGDEDVL